MPAPSTTASTPKSPFIQLPDRPNLRYLRDQARNMVRKGVCASLSSAQFAIARRYGYSSWPKLEAAVVSISSGRMGVLERAILDDNASALTALLHDDPDLIHREGHWIQRKRHNKYQPLAYAAYFGKVEAMEVLLDAGADVHIGQQRALRAATYSDDYEAAIDLLIQHGADPNATTRSASGYDYSVIDYPCMLLAAGALRRLLSHGARLTPRSIGFVVAANERNPKGKAKCLEVMAESGQALPDTSPMAMHRRDIDRIEVLLRKDPGLFSRHFDEKEIFPAEFGTTHPAASAYVTPLTGGVTLLHMAVEFCDMDMVEWLLKSGADANVRSAVDADGYGGWTPLFHTVATLHQPRGFPEFAAVLLRHGADPLAQASIRKPMPDDAAGSSMWKDVTAVEYANDFIYPDLVNQEAVSLIAAASANCRMS